MALITCCECGKQVSDRAASCPNCGCPISLIAVDSTGINIQTVTDTAQKTLVSAKSEKGKKKKRFLLIGVVSLIALIAAVFVYSMCFSPEAKYTKGITAMEAFDWETAANYFTGLDYEESEKMLTDCMFMMALEESVLRRMEKTGKEASDYRSLVSTELAYLEKFKNAEFYDNTIKAQAKKYIEGLNKQLDGLTYDYYCEYQRDWNTGLVARYEALNALYEKYNFMADNNDFIGEYIKQLSYHQKWLNAFKSLEKNGAVRTKDPKWTYNYIEYYYKNNTPYSCSYVFDIVFSEYKEYNKRLGTTTVYVNDVGPYSEYTVRAYYTDAAKKAHSSKGLSASWSSYYNEIKVK